MKIFLLVLLVLVLLALAVGYTAFYIASVRRDKRQAGKGLVNLGGYKGQIAQGKQWFREMEPERVDIVAQDGVALAGLYLHAENSKGTVILMHGYRMDGYTDFSCVYKYYYDLGYSLLSVFQRAHGLSGGKYICFGIKERFDCRDWALYVADRFGPEHNIFLDGLSMGCTTVLMAAGLELPGNVRGIVADCGFTSPIDQFRHLFKTKYHLPLHPIIDLADIFARLMAGFSYKEYSTLEAMKSCAVPVLFLHGEDDKLVPMEHTVRAFRACSAEKKLITVPGAGHGMSYLTDREQCQRELKNFLDKYTK